MKRKQMSLPLKEKGSRTRAYSLLPN